MRRLVFLAALAIGVGAAPAAFAQAVAIDPSTVEFVASPDHATIGLDGQPVLTRYELREYLEGATLPFKVQDLGKPAPDANNKIIITNRSWFVGAAFNVRCVARVAAIGPHGEGVSGASGPFGNAGPAAAGGTPVIR